MIILIRHGETVWNKKAKKQGQNDSPLTLKGINQAEQLANKIKQIDGIKEYEIVVSPLGRCKQYASIICEVLDIDYETCRMEDNIKEHCFGLWEGKTEQEIEKIFPNFLQKRKSDWWNYIVPMGESYFLLNERVKKFIKESQDKNIILICHEMVSKVVRGHYLNLKEKEIISLEHKQNIYYIIDDNKVQEVKFLDENED